MNLSEDDQKSIEKICKIATDLTGVQLTAKHQSMVASRLQKRLTELKLESFTDYLNYYQAHSESESSKLIGLTTTHHTFFFREFSHFEYLAEKVIPEMIPVLRNRADRTLKVWAAACRRGQEVYSLAMFLDYHLKKHDPSLKYEILGSDVDAESIAIASNGVYLRNELKEAPLMLLADHWAKGTGQIAAYAKVKKSLRERCSFKKINLLDFKKEEAPSSSYDLIFYCKTAGL